MSKSHSVTFVVGLDEYVKAQKLIKKKKKQRMKQGSLHARFYTFSTFIRECVDNALNVRYPRIKKNLPQGNSVRKGARLALPKYEELMRKVAMLNINRKMDNQLDFTDFIRWAIEQEFKDG